MTLPLMLALERLSPLERAAFLLHDVFGLEYEEVAASIGREPAGSWPPALATTCVRLEAAFKWTGCTGWR